MILIQSILCIGLLQRITWVYGYLYFPQIKDIWRVAFIPNANMSITYHLHSILKIVSGEIQVSWKHSFYDYSVSHISQNLVRVNLLKWIGPAELQWWYMSVKAPQIISGSTACSRVCSNQRNKNITGPHNSPLVRKSPMTPRYVTVLLPLEYVPSVSVMWQSLPSLCTPSLVWKKQKQIRCIGFSASKYIQIESDNMIDNGLARSPLNG